MSEAKLAYSQQTWFYHFRCQLVQAFVVALHSILLSSHVRPPPHKSWGGAQKQFSAPLPANLLYYFVCGGTHCFCPAAANTPRYATVCVLVSSY